jgi:hypothetical protein
VGDEYDPGMDGETEEDDKEAQVCAVTRLTRYFFSLAPDSFTCADVRMETEVSESHAAVRLGREASWI